ncbi:MAG: glutamate 5-kinase [Alphaproteobacteria bacterium]|nr:glutamate 5-kinase [Alphaproteobacteria bacterium]
MTARQNSSAAVAASRAPLAAAKRIVVKIGSALLVDDATGAIRTHWLEGLARDIAALRTRGVEILVVSSGSIGAGRRQLGLTGGSLKLEEKQASAAVGQIALAHAYKNALAARDIAVAQILLAPGDTEERRRHLNARATILQLLKLGAVPVINENDSTATQEIQYGDNDRLAARVGTMVSADTVVLLSDVDGLYTADPTGDPTAKLIPEIAAITPDIEAMAGQARLDRIQGGLSTGGMVTKLSAAKIAVSGGARLIIAKGDVADPLARIDAGGPCSVFLSSVKPQAARKRWIAGLLTPAGRVVIDDGAARALGDGKSLLPAGVVSVSGAFHRGDPVTIATQSGETLGVGLSAYDSVDAGRIVGKRSAEIPSILGYEGRVALIHRDDMALED